MNLKNRCLEYFNYFSNKDIDNVMIMFDSKQQPNAIFLKDWNIEADAEKLKLSISDIFDSVDTIKVFPLSLHREDNVVFCQIKILVNNEEELDVIDVITFNENGYIKNIKAYKC